MCIILQILLRWALQESWAEQAWLLSWLDHQLRSSDLNKIGWAMAADVLLFFKAMEA